MVAEKKNRKTNSLDIKKKIKRKKYSNHTGVFNF